MLKSLLSPFKAIWDRSWTKFLAWCQGVSGAFLLAINEVNTYITDPTFKSYLSQLEIPRAVTTSLVIIGIITWLAHGRKND